MFTGIMRATIVSLAIGATVQAASAEQQPPGTLAPKGLVINRTASGSVSSSLWSSRLYLGVMAQEVAAIAPGAVRRGTDDYLRVDYQKLGPRLQLAASDVKLPRNSCGRGLHRDLDGGCVPNGYVEAPLFGLPYVAPPTVGLPYVTPPTVGLPYVGPPIVGLPYVRPPTVGLPYVGPPTVGLPYVPPPTVGLPYVGPPTAGLPYIGPREYVAPRACSYGYTYLPRSRRCVPI